LEAVGEEGGMSMWLKRIAAGFRRPRENNTPAPAHSTCPRSGEVWILLPADKGDPFPPKLLPMVTIREVRSEWVRYSHGNGGFFDDERMPVSRFTAIYEKGST
jgi:hypothetical protein